jgi:hypothetical protein
MHTGGGQITGNKKRLRGIFHLYEGLSLKAYLDVNFR